MEDETIDSFVVSVKHQPTCNSAQSSHLDAIRRAAMYNYTSIRAQSKRKGCVCPVHKEAVLWYRTAPTLQSY